ncbi:MAG: LptF/LptG family permease, partial [Reyranella sp.]|nr:LptF/LptG family permease [Reyranella sp.]
ALDLAPFLKSSQTITYKASDRYLHELLFPDLTRAYERKDQGKLRAEGHARLSSPLYNIAFMAMALAAVLGSSFSRLGYGRRIAVVSAAAAMVRIIGFAVQSGSEDSPWLNVAQYLTPILATAWALSQLFRTVERRSGWREWLPFAPTRPKGVAT